VRTSSCISRNFRVQVRIRERSRLRFARLFVDAVRRLSTTKKTFSVPISAARLRTGPHRITVSASDLQGNRATRTVRFRRCASRPRR